MHKNRKNRKILIANDINEVLKDQEVKGDREATLYYLDTGDIYYLDTGDIQGFAGERIVKGTEASGIFFNSIF